MDTRTFLLSGLNTGISEDDIRSRLERFGPVVRVDFVRTEDPDRSAIVEMAISKTAAIYLVLRMTIMWQPEHCSVVARLLNDGDPI